MIKIKDKSSHLTKSDKSESRIFYMVYSRLYDTLDQDYALAIPKLFSLLLTAFLPPSDLLYLYFGLRRPLQVKPGVANHILHPKTPLTTSSDIFWSLRIPNIPDSRSNSGTKGMFWTDRSSQHVQLIFTRKTPVDIY